MRAEGPATGGRTTRLGVEGAGAASCTLAIVDYGLGNRRSVEKAFAHVGAPAVLTSDHATLRAADGLVLPGVGAFPEGMRRLRASGLVEVLRERVREAGVPVIGLCLGMQLLLEGSDEHEGAEGLGLVPGWVRRLDPRGGRLPHIGWNEVRWERSSPLVEGLPQPATFYHVHSFVPHPADPGDVLGTSEHGAPFASVIERGHVFGAQFHPEKSSLHGLALLRNFGRVCAGARAGAEASAA